MPSFVLREGLRIKLTAIPGMSDPDFKRGDYFFQCPPLEEFTIEYAHSHLDYDTIRDGQYSRKGGVQLRMVTFDTLVVDWGLFTLLDPAQDMAVEEHTALLVQLLESGDPVLLTMAHRMPRGGFGGGDISSRENWSLTLAGPELQMPATLRNLRVTERAGEGDARYLNCSFVEYRDPAVSGRRGGKLGRAQRGAAKVGGVAGRAAPSVRPPTMKFPVSVTVLPTGEAQWQSSRSVQRMDKPLGGSSFMSVARAVYGDPNMARQIAIANFITDWGLDAPLNDHPRFRKGGKLTCPAPFESAIQAP